METNLNTFSVSLFGKLERYNEVISKCRCRIFYKGKNRNGTYITDEFADSLLKTIQYTPIKGIYNEQEEDYTDHGVRRSEGRIYGVVPENPNLSWEKHLDDGGIEREYATVDALIYTGLYREANEILDKSQSMEIYRPSIKGRWETIDGKEYFVYESGCFLGLQILGDETEPCFEGAAFYSLFNKLKDVTEALIQYQENYSLKEKEGEQKMTKVIFQLSDSQKEQKLFELLNPVNEEGEVVFNTSIVEVYEKYALVYNYDSNSYERVYYSKNEETDTVEIVSKEPCFVIDVNEEEKRVLSLVKKANNDTYENLDVIFEENENLKNENSEKNLKIEELNNSISTLNIDKGKVQFELDAVNTELNNVKNEYSTSLAQVETLINEKNELETYKKNVEDTNKKAVIASYSDSISEEIADKYLNDLDSYTIEELDKELTYEIKKANPNIFSKKVETNYSYIPKEQENNSPWSCLDAYEKKNK